MPPWRRDRGGSIRGSSAKASSGATMDVDAEELIQHLQDALSNTPAVPVLPAGSGVSPTPTATPIAVPAVPMTSMASAVGTGLMPPSIAGAMEVPFAKAAVSSVPPAASSSGSALPLPPQMVEGGRFKAAPPGSSARARALGCRLFFEFVRRLCESLLTGVPD